MRFLLGLSFGIILGAGGIIALLVSGTGDFFLASSPRMQALETELREVKKEREFVVGQLKQKLAEVAARDDKMAQSFESLRRRFERMESLAVARKEAAGVEAPGEAEGEVPAGAGQGN